MYSLVQIQSTNTHMMMATMVQARLTTGIMISRWVAALQGCRGNTMIIQVCSCYLSVSQWICSELTIWTNMKYEPNPVYSGAPLIRMANVWKNNANYPNMWIIRPYFMLHSYEWQRFVSRASMQIKQGMQISKGQIITALQIFPLNTPLASISCLIKNHVNFHLLESHSLFGHISGMPYHMDISLGSLFS